ncbi:phage tail protein [Kribbella sp. NPDC048915]|uniref:phage tail protein n=1 Tax=Kribbella sp. NPDC048915 TaxID=3155148 RepID=UPI0033EA119C
MRGTSLELATPYPLGSLLPPVLQEDPLLMQFTAAVDFLLAPAISSLDCLTAYVDPALAPPDGLGWLAGWVGADLIETWPIATQRAAIAQAVELQGGRGTVDGLRRHLMLLAGTDVEVTDTGGVTWSLEPVDDLGPQPTPQVFVVVRSNEITRSALDAAVDAAKPAHVTHEVRLEPVSDER